MNISIGDFFDSIIDSLKRLVTCPGIFVLLTFAPFIIKMNKEKKK